MTDTLSTEAALNAALDADPGNHLLRYALADCLEESAREMTCPGCRGGWRSALLPGGGGRTIRVPCLSCHGTGWVSDGRRERAEGLRVLAQLGRVPRLSYRHQDCRMWVKETNIYAHGGETMSGGLESFALPDEWVAAMTSAPEFAEWMNVAAGWRGYPTRREADDAAALAWGTLPAETRSRILGAGQ